MKIEWLQWDSEFFGIKTGRVFLNKEDNWDTNVLKHWEMVYIFVEPDDFKHNQYFQQNKVPLVDEKITYFAEVSSMKLEDNSLSSTYSYFSSDKDDEVIRIGVQSGLYSRFNVDPEIPKAKFLELYTIWMKKSISRQMAEDVIVYQTGKNEIAGVITLTEKNKRADIGIIAVDENFRGQNIGKVLVKEAINFSIRKGYSLLQVVTQKKNEAACRFYEGCGFIEESVINIYHFRSK